MSTSYNGDHIDLSSSTFYGSVTGKNVYRKVEHHYHGTIPTALRALPSRPPVFIGRTEELNSLINALKPSPKEPECGESAVSTVSGMGGVGKTALALTAAHHAINQNWFGAALFIDLRGYTANTTPVSPLSALDSILRALGVPAEHIPPSLGDRAALYRSKLEEITEADQQDRPALIFADNVATPEQVEPLLPGLGGHKIIITSRGGLYTLQGSRHIDVDVLSPASATRLLHDSLTIANPSDKRASDTEALARVAKACGCLPLALKISAALLVRSPRLSTLKLATRLSDVGQRLEKLNDGRTALRVVFDMSLERMNDDQVDAFLLLGLMPGTHISTEAASVLMVLPVEEAEETLEDLTATFMIIRLSDDRWTMHDLVRDYARHRLQLTKKDPDSAQALGMALDGLLLYYARVAGQAQATLMSPGMHAFTRFENEAEALSWLDEEREALIASIETSYRSGMLPTATDIALCIAQYLNRRRFRDECVNVSAMALNLAQELGDRRREAGAATNLGAAFRAVGRADEAITVLQHACNLRREEKDLLGEATATGNLGTAFASEKRWDEAIEALKKNRAICSDIGASLHAARALSNLGSVLASANQNEDAVATLTQATQELRNLGDVYAEAMTMANLGSTLYKQNQNSEAINILKRARFIFRNIGEAHSEAEVAMNLGKALSEIGCFDHAVTAFQDAADGFTASSDDVARSKAIDHLSSALRQAAKK